MNTFNSISELQEILQNTHKGKSVGLVPTMGALHKGHLSLIKASLADNDITVCSVYVNPTQFNDKSDLERYPRDLESDKKLLEDVGCDILFAPTDNEIYPEPDTRKFDFGSLETVMEGKFRPGHFNGVGQIVSKLFTIVKPYRAYFGLKDFQQLAIIRKLVELEKLDVKIIPCPILREDDGLALSSRNALLEPQKRISAPLIYQILKDIKKKAGSLNISELKKEVKDAISDSKELELEYFEIVNDNNLQPITEISSKTPATACIAVYAGKIRLIDNIQLNS